MPRSFNSQCINSINRLSLAGIFLLYLLIWTGVNWPALRQSWWVNDDYAILAHFDPYHNLQLGRPLESLQHWIVSWEANDYEWLNPILRYGQGMLHVLVTTLAAWLIYRATNQRLIFVAMLLFLIWPFQGEAVLWRASAIPLGAFLSMVGLVLIMHNEFQSHWLRIGSGMVFISLAVLTHQLAALAALVVWLLMISFGHLAQTQWRWQVLSVLLSGYIVGTIISLWFIKHYNQNMGRASLSTDWSGKALLMVKLNGLLVAAKEFPTWLTAGQILLIGGAMLLLGSVFLHYRQHWMWWQGFALATLLVLPYAPLLVVAEDSLAPRNLYFGPFLLVGATLLVSQLVERHFIPLYFRHCLIGLLLFVLSGYSIFSWHNDSEYVTLYQRDQASIHQIEDLIITQGGNTVDELVIASAPGYLRTWNPYELKLMWGDAKKSAFLVEWAGPALISRQSTLTAVDDKSSIAQCQLRCQEQAIQLPFFLMKLTDTTWCLCP